MTEAEPVDRIFFALAHPIRRRMVAQLASAGESSITDLAAPFDVSLMAISKHVHVLEDAGVVTVEPEGRIHWVRVNERALEQARAWLDHYANPKGSAATL